MRSKFDEQLELLHREMITMGALCEKAISLSTQALTGASDAPTEPVFQLAAEIDRKERDIEAICLRLLLHQQPVARDLRTVSSALKMVTDAQRIGTQSADISEIVALGNIRSIPEGLPMRDMATAVVRMVTDSIDAFVRQDGKIARSVIEYDDVVDGYFNTVKADVIALLKQPKESGEALVDLLMIAKYYERIGDHAVNIAKWVLFSLTGNLEIHEDYYEEGGHVSEK